MKINTFLPKVIVKKTNTFFKFSIGLFIVSLIMVSSGMVFLLNQYSQWNDNFLKNDNTHIITITSKMSEQEISQLKFSDEKELVECVTDFPNSKVFGKYTIECGVLDNENNVYYISTTTDQEGILLGLENYRDDVTYANNVQLENLKLNIPVVNVRNGGFDSSETVSIALDKIESVGKRAAVNLFLDSKEKELYVSTDKFKEMVEIMFGDIWDTFVEKYDSGNPYSMQIVKSYYVYLKNMKDIEVCADILEGAGYNVNYTIKAFNDISGDVDSSMMIIMVMISMILVFSIITMIMSFNSYFKMQQRDMGILKQMGYKEKVLSKIYRAVLLRPFGAMVLIIVSYTTILSVFVLDNVFLAVLVNLVLLIVMAVVFGIVEYILRSYVKRNIIYLLKKSKEVE